MAEEKTKQLAAIDIIEHTTVANPTGGAKDVRKGSVLLVPDEINQDDARFLVALDKAKPCAPALKAERAAAAKPAK